MAVSVGLDACAPPSPALVTADMWTQLRVGRSCTTTAPVDAVALPDRIFANVACVGVDPPR